MLSDPIVSSLDASHILARLVEFAYLPSPPPSLPQTWQQAFDAVFDVLNQGRRARFQAFTASLEGLPEAFDMLEQVKAALPETEDRSEPHRIFYRAEDALHDPPDLDWCVEGLLTRPSLSLLVGDPGTKKTFLTIDLAVCVALGKDWLGRKVQQSSTLFIDEETGLNRLWSRLNSSLRAHQAGYDTPLHYVSLGGFDLRSEADAQTLTHRALALDARLILVDALAGVMRGGDENNVTSIQPVVYHLRRMAEYCRAAVILVHHNNRFGSFRGSSAISAGMDLMLSIESAPEDSLIQLRPLKSRHQTPPPFCAEAHFENSSQGIEQRFWLTATDQQPRSTPRIDLRKSHRTSTATELLAFLAENQAASVPQMISSLGSVAQGTIRNLLHQLTASGLILRADGGKRGKKALYKLSAKGLDLTKVLTINEPPLPQNDNN